MGKKKKINLRDIIWCVKSTIHILWTEDCLFKPLLITICILLLTAPFSMIKFKDINTTGNYYFSTLAQTMGALVAITLTALLTVINVLKTSDRQLTRLLSDILKRRALNDQIFKRSLLYCFLEIIFAVIGIIVSGNNHITNFTFTVIGWSTLVFGLFGIYYLVIFITNRISMYFSPIELIKSEVFKKNTLSPEKRIMHPFDLVDFEEMRILIQSLEVGNEYTKDTFFVNQNSSFPVYLFGYARSTLFSRIKEDTKQMHFTSNDEKNSVFLRLFHNIIYSSSYFVYNRYSNHADFEPSIDYNDAYPDYISYYLFNNIKSEEIVDYTTRLFHQIIGHSKTIFKRNESVIPDDYDPNPGFLCNWIEFALDINIPESKFRVITDTAFFNRVLYVIEKHSENDYTDIKDKQNYQRLIIEAFKYYWYIVYVRLWLFDNRIESEYDVIAEKQSIKNNLQVLTSIINHIEDKSIIEKALDELYYKSHRKDDDIFSYIRFRVNIDQKTNIEKKELNLQTIINELKPTGYKDIPLTKEYQETRKTLSDLIHLKNNEKEKSQFYFGYFFPDKKHDNINSIDTEGAFSVEKVNQKTIDQISKYYNAQGINPEYAIAGYKISRWQSKDW